MPSLASHANVIPARHVQRSNKERCVPMNRFSARVLLLIFPSLCGYPARAQSSAPHVEPAKAHNTSSSARIVPVGRQQLFGSIPVSTRSKEARRFVELSLDKYENHIVDGALGMPAAPSKKIRSLPSAMPCSRSLRLVAFRTLPPLPAQNLCSVAPLPTSKIGRAHV